MTPDVIGLGTLMWLAELQTGGRPVPSVYLDLDACPAFIPAGEDARLGALLSEARRDGAELDVDHVQSALAGGRTLGELLLATAGGSRAAVHARGAAAGTVLTQPVATLSANV